MPLYALVLAGGSGERFWPMSRRSHPKQLLSLFSGATLLEGTLQRLAGLVPLERIIVLTNKEQEAAVRCLLPAIPAENIVAEPDKRDTAAAIALGVGIVARRDRNATMIVLPADQIIRDVAGFHAAVRTAVDAAEETESLVTLGVKPTWPCTFFGYIERGRQVAIRNQPQGAPGVYEVLRFREKPATELAESFLRDGCFRWNAGIFIWKVEAIVRELEQHVPPLGTFVARLHEEGRQLEETVATDFPTLPKVSIDYAVMEKVSRILVVEAEFDWDDVGNWIAASKYWKRDPSDNAANVSLTTIDSTSNIVFADPTALSGGGGSNAPATLPHVALVGVDDLILVQTRDAILVCNRHQVDKIKHLVAQVPRELL